MSCSKNVLHLKQWPETFAVISFACRMESTLAVYYPVVLAIDFSAGKGHSLHEMWWSYLNVCVFDAASLYLSAGRPMTNRLLLSFQ